MSGTASPFTVDIAMASRGKNVEKSIQRTFIVLAIEEEGIILPCVESSAHWNISPPKHETMDRQCWSWQVLCHPALNKISGWVRVFFFFDILQKVFRYFHKERCERNRVSLPTRSSIRGIPVHIYPPNGERVAVFMKSKGDIVYSSLECPFRVVS